ncbi:hypothetical protein RB2501_13959 [Robiginitalea biformata HTCC2501]|uniref:Uncharacterized protein n=1 Tax=Robiginitalea biformata (strain ATCC BAA-864 / DSM 15991 / KCTC 12146 / HTCC2501) TaxID=313596 RepID=A4CKN9_ROBBH|nr:hypothetical protein RB2501_13959 [Robiginitalea biformata HTCC2501]
MRPSATSPSSHPPALDIPKELATGVLVVGVCVPGVCPVGCAVVVGVLPPWPPLDDVDREEPPADDEPDELEDRLPVVVVEDPVLMVGVLGAGAGF